MAKYINPADVYRNDSMSTKFEQFRRNKALFGKANPSPMVNHKTAGTNYNMLKGTNKLGMTGALEYLSNSKIVQVAIVGGLTYVGQKPYNHITKTRAQVKNIFPTKFLT